MLKHVRASLHLAPTVCIAACAVVGTKLQAAPATASAPVVTIVMHPNRERGFIVLPMYHRELHCLNRAEVRPACSAKPGVMTMAFGLLTDAPASL